VIAGARGAAALAPLTSLAAAAAAAAAAADGAEERGVQAALAMHDRLPALRPLGQIESTYIVAEAPDGLYLVDQHAAHERVLYERLQAAREAGEAASQPLLASAVVALSPAHAALAEELAEELAALGWDLDATDGAAVLLRAVPAALAAGDPEQALVEYLDRVEAEERLSGPDRTLASLACRAAVMAGDRVEAEQQRELLRALERAATPHTCPHGRPTMLHLSRAALERSFGRR